MLVQVQRHYEVGLPLHGSLNPDAGSDVIPHSGGMHEMHPKNFATWPSVFDSVSRRWSFLP